MIRYIFIIALYLFLNNKSIAKDYYTGTWVKGVGPDSGSGGEILMKSDDDEIKFQLELWQGPPSYDSGYLEGKLTILDGKGTFKSDAKDEDESCEIQFIFLGKYLKLKHINENYRCDFGQSVYATGSYIMKDSNEPKFNHCDPRGGACDLK